MGCVIVSRRLKVSAAAVLVGLSLSSCGLFGDGSVTAPTGRATAPRILPQQRTTAPTMPPTTTPSTLRATPSYSPTPAPSAPVKEYASTEEMLKAAPVVVSVTASNAFTTTKANPPTTTRDATVDFSMKGSVPVGSTIKVKQTGDKLEPYALEEFKHYVLFLVPTKTPNTYTLLGGTQGGYLVGEAGYSTPLDSSYDKLPKRIHLDRLLDLGEGS